MSKKVAFHTIGCKVNQYDTEMVISQFKQNDYKVVDFSEDADVYVINTCTVTNISDKKSRQIIRKAHRAAPKAKIVVLGCFAQTSPEQAIDLPGVNLVVGTNDRKRIVDLVEQLELNEKKSLVNEILDVTEFEDLPVVEFEGRTRATLKIQDGCNEYCSYCKVPFARGQSRSRKFSDIIKQVSEIALKGYQEIVLTGVHLGAYGKDLKSDVNLVDVICEVSRIEGIHRVRISSIDPNEIDDQLLYLIADNPKVCRHLHIPLQSGSDTILKAMRRKYSTDAYLNIVKKARGIIDDVSITTDMIVGFPGEDEESFKESYQFAKKVAFSKIHVFKYSKRDNTPAVKMCGQVDSENKNARSAKLLELSSLLSQQNHAKFVGRVVRVLVEKVEKNVVVGFTDNYVRTQIQVDSNINLEGKLISAKINSFDAQGIAGISCV